MQRDEAPFRNSEAAAVEPEPLLRVENLVVSYNRVVAVHGISFQVREGSVVSLIGANGAGKSSTLAATAGLLRPRSGSIRFASEEISRLRSAARVRGGLVLVPEGRQILAQLSVEENLELGAYQRRDGEAVRRELAAIYARFPVLGERRGLAGGSLSGGEQQMLAIARGLLAKPRLLLLDEPSLGLAPLIVDEVFRILREIHASGATILLVEQNARRALALSDYAYVLQNGRIVREGTGEALQRDEAVVAAYLGTRGIAGESRRTGNERRAFPPAGAGPCPRGG